MTRRIALEILVCLICFCAGIYVGHELPGAKKLGNYEWLYMSHDNDRDQIVAAYLNKDDGSYCVTAWVDFDSWKYYLVRGRKILGEYEDFTELSQAAEQECQ